MLNPRLDSVQADCTKIVRFAPESSDLPISPNHSEAWQRVCRRLRAEVGEDVFQSWFKSMELDGLDCVVAANPPIDLTACSLVLRHRHNRLYDRNFVRSLRAEVARRHALFPDLGPVDLTQVRTLFDFDDQYVAPRSGFAGASDYYARSSSAPLIPQIAIPGLVVHAEDDPVRAAAEKVAKMRRDRVGSSPPARSTRVSMQGLPPPGRTSLGNYRPFRHRRVQSRAVPPETRRAGRTDEI